MGNFCPMPFHHLLVEPDGNCNICCEHIVPNDKKINVGSHDIDAWLKSDYVNEVREWHRNNLQHPGCRDCWQQESRKVESRRQQQFKEFQLLGIDDLNPKIKKLEINLGNLCNLKCLMCDGKSSSALLAENQKLGIDDISQDQLKWDHSDVDYLLEFVIKTRPKVLAVRGGEPLFNKDLFYLLSSLPDDYANKLVLHIITNATIWNDQWKNLLSKFRLVMMYMSVDAVEDLYEYIRFPAKWEVVDQNIKDIVTLNNVKPCVLAVVQNLNVLHLGPLLDWCRSLGIRLQLNLLHTPGYLDVTNLPVDTKSKAIENLRNLIESTPEPHLQKFLNSTLELIKTNSTTTDERLANQFEDIISIRNKIRNNSHKMFFSKKGGL